MSHEPPAIKINSGDYICSCEQMNSNRSYNDSQVDRQIKQDSFHLVIAGFSRWVIRNIYDERST